MAERSESSVINEFMQADFLLRASRALHGNGATLTLQTVAEAIELAYRQGLSAGFEEASGYSVVVEDAPHDPSN